jgi:hypothetical protein
MNTNALFDYGQFLELEIEMLKKQAENDTTISLFAFTFEDSGTYVFNDASSTDKLTIITVVGLSETCPNSDKYLNSISSQSLASTGVQQNKDLILKLNYPLIIGLTTILIFTVVMIIATISWCISKKWSIRRTKQAAFRKLQLELDIMHRAASYDDGNDFVTYQEPDPEVREKEEEEDDLDHINLDIHQDIMDVA